MPYGPVHAEHRVATERYLQLAAKYGTTVTYTVVLSTPLAVFALILSSGSPVATRVLTGGWLSALGALFIVFPFTTSQTVSLLGIQRSVRVMRTVAVLMMVGGLALMVSAFVGGEI